MTAEGLDLSHLTAADAAAALRSLPRRFRTALAPPVVDGRSARPDDLVHRIGADGRSAVDHVEHVVRSLGLLDRALEQLQLGDDPALHPAVLDDRGREVDWADRAGPPPELDDVLDDLATASERLAVRAERAPAGGWARTARVAGGGTITAHELLIEAVRSAVAHLRAAEATVDALRGRP